MKTHTMAVLCGVGIGYVLGSKAGRERYEQIRRTTKRVAENPRVRDAAHLAQEKVEERVPGVKEKVANVSEKVRPQQHGEESGGWPSDPRSRDEPVPPTYPRMSS